MHWTLPKKIIYRPRVSTSKAKWLKKLKQEKNLKAATQFAEKNIGKCHKTAVR